MRLGACLLLACCLPLAASEPFQLQVTTLSSTWFPSGAVLHLPPERCSEFQVRLSKPWSSEIPVGELELKVDDAYPRFTRLTGPDGILLNVRTREPLGLFTRELHRIEASAGARSSVAGQWKVLHWDRTYIQAVAVGSNGNPIQVQLDEPPGGVVLVAQQGSVRVRGQTSGGVDSTVTANGLKLLRLPAKSGYQFDQEISLGNDIGELVVKGEDAAGDVTVLVLPLLR